MTRHLVLNRILTLTCINGHLKLVSVLLTQWTFKVIQSKIKFKKYYKGLVTEEHISFNRIVYTMRFDPVYVQR